MNANEYWHTIIDGSRLIQFQRELLNDAADSRVIVITIDRVKYTNLSHEPFHSRSMPIMRSKFSLIRIQINRPAERNFLSTVIIMVIG